MILLDGRPLAKKILEKVKKEVAKLPFKPGLAAILVGSDQASHLYVSLKEQVAKEVGVNFYKTSIPEETVKEELIELIEKLNKDDSIHAILLQLPLPSQLDANMIIPHIDPKKDVDGFSYQSLVRTPAVEAIRDLLKASKLRLKGKSAFLFVKSEAFSRKVAQILEEEGIHIIQDSKKADIIISALGKPASLRASEIKRGVVVVDVGIAFQNGRTVGDSAPDIAKKAAFLSPVPGGVGPLTVVHLFENLLKLAKQQRE